MTPRWPGVAHVGQDGRDDCLCLGGRVVSGGPRSWLRLLGRSAGGRAGGPPWVQGVWSSGRELPLGPVAGVEGVADLLPEGGYGAGFRLRGGAHALR